MAKYYYNGVLLPEIPADVLAQYPYVWLGSSANHGTYLLYACINKWWYADNKYFRSQTELVIYKKIGDEWVYSNALTGGDFTVANFTNIWSNYDIPNGSADSTTIYFYGSEPIPESSIPKSGYLIRSGPTLYTVTDGALSALTETAVTASLFQTYGVDDIPDGALLATLTDPELLYWQDSEYELPVLELTVKGTPPLPQMFTSNSMDMTHESIAGIDHAAVDASEDVRFAISFDGGITWKAHDGSAWFDTSDTVPGMLASTMNTITAEQWAEVVVLDSYMVRFWLPNVTAYVKSVVMHYINP